MMFVCNNSVVYDVVIRCGIVFHDYLHESFRILMWWMGDEKLARNKDCRDVWLLIFLMRGLVASNVVLQWVSDTRGGFNTTSL